MIHSEKGNTKKRQSLSSLEAEINQFLELLLKSPIHGTGHFEKWEDSCSEEINFRTIREGR